MSGEGVKIVKLFKKTVAATVLNLNPLPLPGSHTALTDMPDTLGINADHDVRYQRKMLFDSVIKSFLVQN